MSLLSQQLLPLLPDGDRIVIVDCGARGATEDGKWNALAPRLTLHGFEPDVAECARLNSVAAAKGLPHKYYPLWLAGQDAERRKLYIVPKVDSVSLYPPAERRMSRWRHRWAWRPEQPFSPLEYLRLAGTAEVATRSLNSWHAEAGRPEIDFVKLDVQGAELEILNGAGDLLPAALGVEAEVNFVPCYEGQPLFADVDTFLRRRDFTFYNLEWSHAILHYAGRVASPIQVVFPTNPLIGAQGAGQFFTSNALYFRDPLDPLWPADWTISATKLLKLAALAETCGQVEYAFELVAYAGDQAQRLGDAARAAELRDAFERAGAAYNALGAQQGRIAL